MAHDVYGKISWAKLINPTIELCENGWIVDEHLAFRIKASKEYLIADEAFRKVFAPNGTLLVHGDVIRRETYANTLKSISKYGVEIFYTGWIAESLVKTIHEAGGIATLQDFKQYNATQKSTLIGLYRGYQIVTAPPPASGAVLLSIFGILGNFDFPNNNISRQIMVESFKHGYAQRAFFGDPIDPIYKNISQIAKYFTDPQTELQVSKRISRVTSYLQ